MAPAFLAMLGICCYMWGLSSCGDRGLLFVAWASHCGGFSCCGAQALEHEGFSGCVSKVLELGLSSGGEWAQLFHSTWNLL